MGDYNREGRRVRRFDTTHLWTWTGQSIEEVETRLAPTMHFVDCDCSKHCAGAGCAEEREVSSIMKIPRALLSLIMLLATVVATTAQEPRPTPEEFQTKLESLISETGAVIVKGYTRVGSMNGSRGAAYVTAWEVSNARTGRREQGVSVEIADAAANRPDIEERAYIDYDELAPLLSGIDYIMKLDDKATKLSRYEAQYQTRGGLVLATFSTPDGVRTAISTWGGRRPRFVLRQTGLAEFRNLLESAREVLEAPSSR